MITEYQILLFILFFVILICLQISLMWYWLYWERELAKEVREND